MIRIQIPLFVNRRNRYLYLLVMALSAWLLYAITNHLPPLVTPTVYTFTPIEKALPLLPWSIWPYLTCYFVMFFLALSLRDMGNLQRMLYAFVIVQVAGQLRFSGVPRVAASGTLSDTGRCRPGGERAVQLDASRGCGQKLPTEPAHRELLAGKSRVLAGKPRQILAGGLVVGIAFILDPGDETTLSLGRTRRRCCCSECLRPCL